MNDDLIVGLMQGVDFSLLGGDKEKAIHTYEECMQSAGAKKRLAEWQEQGQGDPRLEKARREMMPALLTAERLFTTIKRQWPNVFYRGLAGVNPEQYGEVITPCLGQRSSRGAKSTRDSDAGKIAFVYNIEPADIALSANVPVPEAEVAMAKFTACVVGMAESFVETEEILHANVLDTGRVYQPLMIGDGVPLFSAKHPCREAAYSNLLEPGLFLNEASIERAAVAINAMPLASGVRSHARARTLVVPVDLEFTAKRLMYSDEQRSAYYPSSYQTLDFLTDPEAWFLLTTERGLISLEWKPFRLDLRIEGNSLVLEGEQSYGCGYKNPRAVFGSFPKE